MSETIHIKTPDSQYPIHIGALPHIEYSHKVLIVSNPKVAGLYLSHILAHIKAPEVYVCIVPCV
ncbi:hypothetical protein [uncultured Helicobacter sp.]|uniref:hypothetical protein n=1 Tax=uncultured Helicobacter sp. TaxID=175537 RepID=UPI00262C2A74|nr:hypothetical protein [uncultured Helicobacter sp.]